MRRTFLALTSAALVWLGAVAPAAAESFAVRVVSSAADQVSGGDARLHIDVPSGVSFDQVQVWAAGRNQRDRFSVISGTRTLTGVIVGLGIGQNTVIVRSSARNSSPAVTLALKNHPITGPIFSGPHQYPFVCTTMTEGLGQPIPDDSATGTRVIVAGHTVGYSRNCSVKPLVVFVYRSTGNEWKDYTPGMERPADMATTTTTEGKTVDFIVRWERGTINRFIYSIAVLAPEDQGPWDLGRSAWNGKVIYRFEGGVGIGHSQGSVSTGASLYLLGLQRGYAVLFSTGTRTSTHYNLQLGGETALMVKEAFIERYDVPRYTVGIGGSGGGLQQYLYGQNHPGLIDGGIPQYSYPDMVSQAVHVGDCELLEHYMDVLDASNPRWATWTNRPLLEGLNASDTLPNPYRDDLPGLTECVNGWRGLSPLALNPFYGYAPNGYLFEPYRAIVTIRWTHFEDIVNVVGVAGDGYARNYWDNIGVQYGLRAVAAGRITPDEFLRLNGSIGGWKNEPEMVQEGQPFLPFGTWDPWSVRNQVYSLDPLTSPAPRTAGDLTAMQRVYEAGLVFRGAVDIPLIDWRHYLEDELDMHNTHQSFASRRRMLNHDGDASNQVVWFTDVVDPGARFDQTPEALEVLDEWLENIRANPGAGVAANKPARAVDRCFDAAGTLVAEGPDVWSGILDTSPAGVCTQAFPVHSTSRREAGGPFEQSLFKCALQPVSAAVASGLYGVWSPTGDEVATLERIFPNGVCDYSKPDAGLPPGW